MGIKEFVDWYKNLKIIKINYENIVFELYETLSFKEKRKLFLIQVYNITVGFLELMGLVLIIPYFNMISNLDQFYESYLIVLASNFININSMEINTILIILSALIISIFYLVQFNSLC